MNNISLVFRTTRIVSILGLLFLLFGCTNNAPKVSETLKEAETVSFNEIIWHIKAIHPEGGFLDIKALDKDGNVYDVKAIQNSDQRSLIDSRGN